MEIRIQNLQKSVDLNLSKIEIKIQKILEASGRDNLELSVVFSGDEYIRELNREYRKIDSATDVLSFPQTGGEFPSVRPGVLGDIVISTEWALREAEKREHTTEDEIDFLLIHGILHLLGFDHEKSREERKKMNEKERMLLAMLKGKGPLREQTTEPLS